MVWCIYICPFNLPRCLEICLLLSCKYQSKYWWFDMLRMGNGPVRATNGFLVLVGRMLGIFVETWGRGGRMVGLCTTTGTSSACGRDGLRCGCGAYCPGRWACVVDSTVYHGDVVHGRVGVVVHGRAVVVVVFVVVGLVHGVQVGRLVVVGGPSGSLTSGNVYGGSMVVIWAGSYCNNST